MPFLRSQIRASSISPLELERAFLQSIMGAPLRSRSSFTCAAVIFVVLVLIFLFPSGCFLQSCRFAPHRLAANPARDLSSACCSRLGAQVCLAGRLFAISNRLTAGSCEDVCC